MEITTPKMSYSEIRWKSFLERGDKLFNYMISNYYNMFDYNNIKHFYLEELYVSGSIYGEEFFIEYEDDIHSNVFLWIKNEFESKELFDKMLWKPFQCPDNPDHMYYGYRKLFQY